MKFCFFTFYYPPDLSAGSFRSTALANALIEEMDKKSSLIVITTSPNRYKSYELSSEFITIKDNLKIYRIKLPKHSGSMFSQALIFIIYFIKAIKICLKEKPDFLIGTSGRLMTAILTWVSSILIKKPYLIDLRDIFSESIADIFAKKNKIIGKFLNNFFSYFDKCVLTNAASVNVVSMGFPEYFDKKGIDTSKWLFYPNGVDDIFVNHKNIKSQSIYWRYNLLAKNYYVTAENINKIISENNFDKKISLFSLDIDGNDYWILKNLNVRPEIIVCEYNGLFGDINKITVPYKKTFNREKEHYSNLYFGCSIKSLTSLLKLKGYIFIGSNSSGNNAYFVKKAKFKHLINKLKTIKVFEPKFRESRNLKNKKTFLNYKDSLIKIRKKKILNLDNNKMVKIENIKKFYSKKYLIS